MSKDRLRVWPNERLDINDFRFAIGEDDRANLHELTSQFVKEGSVVTSEDRTGYILSGFAISNPAAKQLQVTKGKAFLSQRLNGSIVQGVLTVDGDATKIVDMNSYVAGAYGIYIRFEEIESEIQNRIFWNPSGAGSEYTDSKATRYIAGWSLRVESASPGAEWLRIGGVDQATMAITDERPFFFEGCVDSTYASGWSSDGSGQATDRDSDRSTYGIGDLHTFVRAMKQCLEDIKGRGLKRWWDRDIGGMNIGFDAAPVSGRLALGDASYYMQLVSSNPRNVFDAGNDYLEYDRTADRLNMTVAGTERHAWDINTFLTTKIVAKDLLLNPAGDATNAEHEEMIRTQIWDKPWGVATDTENMISGGSAKAYRDMAVTFNDVHEPRLLVGDGPTCKVEVWNPRTLSLESTSPDLSGDLPSGSGEVWWPTSIAVDNSYAYIIFEDQNKTGGDPNMYVLQAYELATWDKRSGWPATGTYLPSSGIGMNRNGIVLNGVQDEDGYLITIQSWHLITAASDPALWKVDKTDGTSLDAGSGDAPTGISARIMHAAVGEGGDVYFVTWGTGPLMHICTARISDLTLGSVGGGGAGYPRSVGNYGVGRIVKGGDDQYLMPINSSGSASDNQAFMFNSATADAGSLLCGKDSADNNASLFCLFGIFDVCFDGMNYWLYGYIDPSGGIDYAASLVKVDAAKIVEIDYGFDRQLPDVASGIFYPLPGIEIVSGSAPSHVTMLRDYGRCVWDGRDIWMTVETRNGETHSGKIVRLPFAQFRN